MSHRCPAPGCDVDVVSTRYACKTHWFSIPKPLRDELWRAYERHGPLSDEHVAAMDACGRFLRGEPAQVLPRERWPSLCLRPPGGETGSVAGPLDVLACVLRVGHEDTCIFGNVAMLDQAEEAVAGGVGATR